jgi:hypothetical protein
VSALLFRLEPGCAVANRQNVLLRGNDPSKRPGATRHRSFFLIALPIHACFNQDAPKIRSNTRFRASATLHPHTALHALMHDPLRIHRPDIKGERLRLTGFNTARPALDGSPGEYGSGGHEARPT